jgi:hypothetical protein
VHFSCYSRHYLRFSAFSTIGEMPLVTITIRTVNKPDSERTYKVVDISR